jgi:hypothetical protein
MQMVFAVVSDDNANKFAAPAECSHANKDWWRLQQKDSPIMAITISTREQFLNGWEDS